MRNNRRRPCGQRQLATACSLYKSIGSFLLTRYRNFSRKWRTFLRSDGFNRRKDPAISQDTDEKKPPYIVGDILSTSTTPKSGDFTADPTVADEGPLIPQGPSLIESGELPQKGPRDNDAVEPSLVQKSPAAKTQKRNMKRQSNRKPCPRRDTAAKGDDVSFLNLETPEIMDIKISEPQDIGIVSGEAPRISPKRSIGYKRRYEPVISQDTEEKRPSDIVGGIVCTPTTPKSGDKGHVTPQGPSLIESGELPQKRPRDNDAVEPSLVHKSLAPKKGKRNMKRQYNRKPCPTRETAGKGDDVSFLNLETPKNMGIKISEPQDIGIVSGEAPRISRKRKAPATEDSQPETFPPAKKTVVENIINPSTTVEGHQVLETPQVEMPGSWRQQTIHTLPPEQLFILKSKGPKGMLDDNIINKAQELLQNQFEGSDGLQSVAALLVPGYSVLKNAVQIHYDQHRKHWLTTCFKNGKILVADSISTTCPTPSVREQILNIYSEVLPEPLKHLQFIKVDQQRNNYDCGVFAIAFAYELLANDGEPTARFDHMKIRDHLISCLQRGRITSFPKLVSK
ncbi:uncharacterized protein [Engystomops pustulosus]|uniref:uncharacterized protein n=1 Tax=Engystomops pustulosus TaxID=76066 RepID=UPI003AFA8BA2